MSHFAEMKIAALVKNERDLIQALEEQFGAETVAVHDTAVPLTGYDARAKKKAHLVIKKGDVAKAMSTTGYNDIGFERLEDGNYSMHYDPMDWPNQKREALVQSYAEKVATRKLKAQGYTVKKETLQDGSVKLIAQTYA
jgi:hypothetical protein